ncbi:DUF262 domain-containing protein [Duganella dendranthematis]|uniref:DUF262 domain-containing protein n=1 Tax=Duganella dendranthematis TaxID=2728021 RepID=A0ABX6M7E2_9BURK|nr:DUF262 domain-containing protein [Duganella dendranthematis]QJD88757.1 DUF262 domain-containing protein [Duganella dendranthematis]
MTQSELTVNSLSDNDIEDWFEAEEADGPEAVLSDEELSQKYADTQIRIVRTSLDFTLHTLVASIKDKSYINIAPGYQRRARWDRRKKSLLIESFLMNIPVPPLFLFEKDYNQYEIMDGRQRLEAISEFLDNKYPLTGLEFWPELQGKRFTDLPGTVQRGLLRRTLNAVVLLAETSRSEDSVDIRLVLFRRLNTGGIKLNPQELRNALYPGIFNTALHELSREELFCDLWKIPKRTPKEDEQPATELLRNTLYRSMMDCELVLRFFGIRDAVAGKTKGSLRQIFDRTMERYSTLTVSQVDLLKSDFLGTLLRITRALSSHFHLLPDGRPSRPLYDAILVAANANPMIDLDIDSVAIKERLAAALAEPEKYEILVGRGNTLEAIKERVALATTILVG